VRAALLCVALLAGCAGVPMGPVARPEIYPDQTTPEAAWSTFAWAWSAGDVDALERVLGGWMKWQLGKELEKNARDAVSAWYRRDAEALVVEDAEWVHRGEALAYLRVVLSSRTIPRLELDFAITRRGMDDWLVTGRRKVR
jgi:hypothetical protein